MGITLFVGNGINRLEPKNDISWGKVLMSLGQKLDGKSLLDLKDDKPYTLIYETLMLRLFHHEKRHDLLLKKHVANLMQKVSPNPYHHKLVNCGVKNIITSNYDYCFEKTGQTQVEHFNSESKYSAFRKTKIGNTYIWHIHGEVKEPESIMLGYEQYGGYLQKIRKYLLPSQKDRKINIANLKKIFNKKQTNSWIDLFLRDEVHILGFNMDYSEIDIWWLLVFKAQCKTKYGIEPGGTIYYHWGDREINNQDNAKLQLLSDLDVTVHSQYEGKPFQSCYDRFLEFKLGNAKKRR